MRSNSEQITSTAFCPDFCMHVRKEVPVFYFLIKQIAYNLTRPFWEAFKSLSHLQLAGQQCRLSILFSTVLWGRSVNVSLRGDPWAVRNKKGQRPFDLVSQSQCIPFKPLNPSLQVALLSLCSVSPQWEIPQPPKGVFENWNQRLRVLWKRVR